jgi:hypothetical protein
MLGPQDIIDWRVEPEEALAAALRRHPRLRPLVVDPHHPEALRLRRRMPILDRFLAQEPLPLDDLLELTRIADAF